MSGQRRTRSDRTGPAPSPRRTRRRGILLDEAILEAAAAELAASGYARMTMDAIARRAGTNKNAIYRRWASRAEIGLAAYRRLAKGDAQPPNTGSLRTDVLEMLRRANRQLSSPNGKILRDLLSSAGSDPRLRAALSKLSADAGSAEWIELVHRAVERGEVGPGALDPRVATVAVVLLRNEFVTRGVARVAERVLEEITDKVYLPLLRRV